jgi:uncharacterized CHY-type Zn-finger protein
MFKCYKCYGELNTGFVCISCGEDNNPFVKNTNMANGDSLQIERIVMPLLNNKEGAKYEKFREQHLHSNKFILEITETGIAKAVKLICGNCNVNINITDYDSW